MKKLVLVVGIIGVLLSLWMVAIGVGEAIEAAQSSTWPSVTGQIVGSVVDISATGARRGNSRSYTPNITYSYAVNGQDYIGNTITPGRLWGSASAHNAVAAFPRGSNAPIYYSPQAPGTSVLENGLHIHNFGKFALALLLLTFAGFLLLGVLSSKQVKSSTNDRTYSRPTKPAALIPYTVGILVIEVVAIFWVVSA